MQPYLTQEVIQEASVARKELRQELITKSVQESLCGILKNTIRGFP